MVFKRISALVSKIQMAIDTRKLRESLSTSEEPTHSDPIQDSTEVSDESSLGCQLKPKDLKKTGLDTLSCFSNSQSSEEEFYGAPLTRQRAYSDVASALNKQSSVAHQPLKEPARKSEIQIDADLGVALREKKVKSHYRS